LSGVPADRFEKLLALAALTASIELVFFKFLPDLSTALIQQGTSALTDFATFERVYLLPGSVHHARFLGNHILYSLAKLLETLYHSHDVRLHTLRVAAGILTPMYACLGAYFVLRDGTLFAWRHFLVPYSLMVLMGLYVFYPGDMPALATLSMALYFLLRERRAAALFLMLVTGLFRESAFHIVALVGMWALTDRSQSLGNRVSWVAVFALAFVVEYVAVRRYFPGPVSAAGGVILDPGEVFFGRGMLSFTTICSLGLAALFPIACWHELRDTPRDWRRSFFLLNCYAFPAWIIFYRMMSGNITEFRLLFPALLPCIYGIAYGARMTVATTISRARTG
jgi:hypothetical protein